MEYLIDSGNTTFMIMCTAFVCVMTPGLAFFYGGLGRRRSSLYLMAQSFITAGIVTLIWIFGGYGLAFGQDIGGFIGNPGDFFAMTTQGYIPDAVVDAGIPIQIFMFFQLMFCIITVPLMTGAIYERINMKGYIWLMIIWTIVIYIPVCHWVWGEGFMANLGFVDHAGGAVIHITSGFAALPIIGVLGKRKDHHMKPSNLMAAAIGTGLLWMGWFGFNGGGALGGNELAVISVTNTVIGLAGGMIAWCIMSKALTGHCEFLDVITGSIAGLATITPAAGYIPVHFAIIVGAAGGIVCRLCVLLGEHLGVDDALDVWGVHGMGGFTGTVLVGVFADPLINGVAASPMQFLIQLLGSLGIAGYSVLVTFIIIKIMSKVSNIRPSDELVEDGLDKNLLGEQVFDLENK